MADILQRDGLTIALLRRLSYKSELGINLKKNLHYFEEEKLIEELIRVNEWYDEFEELHDLALDYRIKSIQSSILKYKRYYPDHQARKVFDDLLGFRSLCDNYDDVMELGRISELRIADMSKGKANDDGYRGVHVYFQLDGSHYPIEIQYNTYYDRQFNNWLHKYLYKKDYENLVGLQLRKLYENAKILDEKDFKEALKMCYLIAKNIDDVGCVALRMTHGKHLAEYKRMLEKMVGYERIQLVTISRPSAYGEYEPYQFVESEEEFTYAVEHM